MFEALALAAILTGTGPDSPPCEPGQTVDCVQGQLPEEVIGRQIDGSNGEVYTVVGLDASGDPILGLSSPSPQTGNSVQPTNTHRLASTGVPTGPYLGAIVVFVLTGTALVRVRSEHV